jgi:AcrR family transcriptional regulator
VIRPAGAGQTLRAEQTRAAIVEAALQLFGENGYEAATMRAIAQRAGVSTGNAYYYFGSKEELIQEFYLRNYAEHVAASRRVLDSQGDLAPRLRGTLRALIDVLSPHHAFAATFYKNAAEPSSPLSPFSSESSPAREASIALYREVVDGSSARIDGELRALLSVTVSYCQGRPRRHFGLRLSRNARIPSRASGSWLVAAITSMAYAYAFGWSRSI